jgi:hypothetical protein
MKTDLGGDRLGSGNKQEISMRNYDRSTHDLSYIWRSSAAPGVLYPFMKRLCLPGDTHEIDLNCDVVTLPTIGPLFGSYKVQLDVFEVPWRLFQGKLHMNMLDIGLDMSAIKLPLLQLDTYWDANNPNTNMQVNPSCILKYLGISGAGKLTETGTTSGNVQRLFNACGLLSYWSIYKQYYSNKQENLGYYLSSGNALNISAAAWSDDTYSAQDVLDTTLTSNISTVSSSTPQLRLTCSDANDYDIEDLLLSDIYLTVNGTNLAITDIFSDITNNGIYIYCKGWLATGPGSSPTVRFAKQLIQTNVGPELLSFDLDNIDTMRQNLLADVASASAYTIDNTADSPYGDVLSNITGNVYNAMQPMEGLGIKTYQSDLFNNWMDTDWIDGASGVNAVSAVDTTGNEFTIDALNLAQKVYVMLNRIAISGGTYDDWLDAVYTHERAKSVENPVYHGSLIKELSFQEVISQSKYEDDSTTQPLGTLAGRGRLTNKHKGGRIKIKTHEPGYIIGIFSLTPRVDYSQGNDFDVDIRTMDDLHKPQLDAIGFQDRVIDNMAWFSTKTGADDTQVYQSAGKQPAWIEYMTDINKCYGNFADENREMFMTLNRRYEFGNAAPGDITTYIDPMKYNQIFADTNLDAQNFWVQISVKNIARRLMSAKVIPNL